MKTIKWIGGLIIIGLIFLAGFYLYIGSIFKSSLVELRMSYNLIDSIGDGFARLEKLKVLWLLDNELEKISSSLCNLKNLTEINLNGNKISDIPECLVQLPNIKRIYIEPFLIDYRLSEKRKMELLKLNPNCEIIN